jgi:hypothetical protein
MANDNINQYNWPVLHRYPWNEVDFGNWDAAQRQTYGGMFEGTFNKAVLKGFGFQGATGLSVGVNPGYAVSASGCFMAISGVAPVATVTVPVPTGSNTVRHLVVARPLLTPVNYIQSPTIAGVQVPLNVDYATQVVLIPGTQGAAADYPFAATGANDVVLFGISVDPGASTISTPNIDMMIRDSLGRHTEFQQYQGLNDDRCRPYRSTPNIVGIKPSQLFGNLPTLFLYVNSTIAASYPQSGGAFVQQDSYYNFLTGAVSGGDGLTSNFTPTIPSAGDYIVARVGLTTANKINIVYGTQGTKAQCVTGILNQLTTGAGSISITKQVMPICYVILGSQDGSTLSSLDVIDARSTLSFDSGAAASNQVITSVNAAMSPYTMTGLEQAIEINATAGPVVIICPSLAANEGFSYSLDRIDGVVANAVTLETAGGDTIADPVYTTAYPFDQFESKTLFAGSTKWKLR